MPLTHMLETEAVPYIRVSSPDQVSGYSLANQEAACRRMAEQRGVEVRRVFSDPGHSAKTLERPGIQAMLDYLLEHRGRVACVAACWAATSTS